MSLLEFQEVSFSYDGSTSTIKNLSFSLEKPTFMSIIGPSGCGKSTIFKLILSLLKANSGKILYKGKNVENLKMYAGYMPQKDMLFPWKTVKDNLAIPMNIKKIPQKEKNQKIQSILQDMGLAHCENKMPYELSGGMRQRVSFARTMLTESDLLLFDEPLSALDSITRVQMQKWLLEQLSHFENKTALFITHDVEEAIFLSEKIYLIQKAPIDTLVKIDVPLPRNRTRNMLNTPEIANLKNTLLGMLETEVTV